MNIRETQMATTVSKIKYQPLDAASESRDGEEEDSESGGTFRDVKDRTVKDKNVCYLHQD